MQKPVHDLHDGKFDPNVQVKEKADFAALASFDESSADSTDIALPIKLEEEDIVSFATPASVLKPIKPHQVQYIRMEDEVLPQSASLLQRPKASQSRPIKLEDGDLSPPISSHSRPQIHQIKSVKLEENSLLSRVPESRFKPRSGPFHKRSSIGLANDSTLRNKPSGIKKRGGTKQHLRKRFQRFEEEWSARQRDRRTHQRDSCRFVRKGAPKPQLFSGMQENAGKGCPRKGPNAEPLGKKRFENRDLW